MTGLAMALPRKALRPEVDTTLGMAIFIGSWTMAFATLFISFLFLRQREPVWPPVGVPLPSLPLAAAGTGVLLLSSGALHLALRRARAGADGLLPLWLAALGLGCTFAALQTRLWLDVWNAGFHADAGQYFGLFYLLTWFHAAHVLCGLVALAAVGAGIARGRVGAQRLAPAIGTALFWHFVDAIWVVLFLGIFVF
ncbi:MAG TPA: cytochrome c oxidase subunit 3 [Planctomycetota bacterium]|nr:cytochrome c oxidase subunit 3 [Planctomycetota bacterium]